MRKQDSNLPPSTINEWSIFLQKTFPDVSKGDIIYGYYDGHGRTVFFNKSHNKIGHVSNANFSRLFFNIWLGNETTFPKEAKILKGID